jgi:hypothetical protein
MSQIPPNAQDEGSNFPIWGWDYRAIVSIAAGVSIAQYLPPGSVPPFSNAVKIMPFTEDLAKSPFVLCKFGLGVGVLATSQVLIPPSNLVMPGRDNSFKFPPGAYPGQKVTLIVENYSGNAFFPRNPLQGQDHIQAEFYGKIRINIPTFRVYDTNVAPFGAWSSWYEDGSQPTNGVAPTDGSRGYRQLILETSNTEALNGIVKRMTVNLMWDGTITDSWAKTIGGMSTPNATRVKSQSGWVITGLPFISDEIAKNTV